MACQICHQNDHVRRDCPYAPVISATPRAPPVGPVNASASRQPTPAPLVHVTNNIINAPNTNTSSTEGPASGGALRWIAAITALLGAIGGLGVWASKAQAVDSNDSDSQAESAPATPTTAIVQAPPQYDVVGLWKTPSRADARNVLEKLPNGTSVYVIGRSGDWVHVRVGSPTGKLGWIHHDSLK
jgi:hypothetical protein